MSKYLFRLEKMHVNSIRNGVGDQPDFDVVTFGIEVGANQYGPLKNYGWWINVSGWDLDFTNAGLRHDANNVARGRWEIGPIDVADNDVVSIDYGVVNVLDAIGRAQSHGGGGANETTRQVGIATWAGLVGVGAASAGVFGAVVAAIVGALAAVVGLFVNDPPNCDGVVGANKKLFTGAELKQGTNNPQQMLLISDRSSSGDTPKGCRRSDIVMTFSVTLVPYYSMKEFLVSKSALTDTHWTEGTGFRRYTKSVLPSFYNGSSTSVRGIIENWELLVIS